MVSQSGTSSRSIGSFNGLLAFIKNFKELIAAILFFVGGVVWVFGYFASKSQLEEVRCHLYANIKYVENQINLNNLSELLLTNALRRQELQNSNPNSPNLAALQIAANDIQLKINKATAQRDDALEAMRTSSCSQSD